MLSEFDTNQARDGESNVVNDGILSTEMSQTQARQRLSVATGSTSSSLATVTRGASALSFLTNVTSRVASTRPLGSTIRTTSNDISWSPSNEESGLQSQGSFVLDMPYGGHTYRQAQQSPLDVESSTLLGANASSDTEAPRENERQTRRGAAANAGEGASGEEDLGITGQASSMWNQTVNQNPELSGIMKAFEKYIPFIVIVTVKCLFEHATGIFVFSGMMVTFYHGNSVVCREVSRQNRRSFWALLAVLVNLTACIVFIYFVFNEDELYLCAVFLSIGKVNSLYDLIWYVGINDFILKFMAVIVKICIVLLPPEVLPHRKRGNYFLFIEFSNQLHRSLAPIPIWLHYLLESLHTDTIRIPAKVLGVILTAAYMVIKGKHILTAAIDWKNATAKLLKSTRYGRCPSLQEVKASGSSCPICHDSLQEPTILHCKHIFCEECVSTWFDRERTCPMCRAQVTDDPAWRDGSTSQFIQLF